MLQGSLYLNGTDHRILTAKIGQVNVEALLRHRGYIILTLIYAIMFGGYVLYERRPQPEPIEIIEPTRAPTLTPAPIQVYVSGAVRQAGVYSLPPGSRLLQAIEAAGGLAADADQERINLAAYVQDAQQIVIPAKGATLSPSHTLPAVSRGGGESDGMVNLNTATVEELETLPGIGPVYAQRIIAYRNEHGPFTDPAQIMEVQGIGPARYEQIKSRITVR